MCTWLTEAGLGPVMVDALAAAVAILALVLRRVARRLARVEREQDVRLREEGKPSASSSSRHRLPRYLARITSRRSTRPSSRLRSPRGPSSDA